MSKATASVATAKPSVRYCESFGNALIKNIGFSIGGLEVQRRITCPMCKESISEDSWECIESRIYNGRCGNMYVCPKCDLSWSLGSELLREIYKKYERNKGCDTTYDAYKVSTLNEMCIIYVLKQILFTMNIDMYDKAVATLGVIQLRSILHHEFGNKIYDIYKKHGMIHIKRQLSDEITLDKFITLETYYRCEWLDGHKPKKKQYEYHAPCFA